MRTVLILILVTGCACAGAQDLPVYNLYFTDYEILNPAFTGWNNCLAVTLSDNHRWIGIKDAPNTQFVYARDRFALPKADNYHGLGMMIARDRNGSYFNFKADLIYSYHVLLSSRRKSYLAFGLSASANQTTIDEGEFYNYNNDPVITGARLSAWNPDLTVGTCYYDGTFFGGMTASNLLPAVSFISDPQPADKNHRLYVLIAGMRTKLRKSDLEMEPSVAFLYLESGYSRIDLNCKGYYRQNFWLGVSFRKYLTGDMASSMGILPSVGLLIRNLEMDYSYELGFSSIQRPSYGTHTLMLIWKICRESKGEVPCPAYN
jgi:type IX secretion system PorP/SprF family membrane protein